MQDQDRKISEEPSERALTPEQEERFEGYLAEILESLGMPLDTPGTRETPRRFLRALYEATDGYAGDPKLFTAFPTERKDDSRPNLDQIIEGPISFFALCEHHALPFYGKAYIGYVANDQIIGISKLTRIVRMWARRFTVQERMGYEIADTLESLVDARGVAVYLQAHHLCTQMRGVQEPLTATRTQVWRGEYSESPSLRSEFSRISGDSLLP